MKATKIMGAVLGVLLVAGLFVGAAAALDATNEGTVFYYEKFTSTSDLSKVGGDWYNLDGQKLSIPKTLAVGETFVIDDTSLVPGAYYEAGNKDGKYIVLAKADAVVKGFLLKNKNGDKLSSIIDGVVGTEKWVQFEAVPTPDIEEFVDGLRFTNPDGTLHQNQMLDGIKVVLNKSIYLEKGTTSGLWTVQAHFNPEMFAPYVPDEYLYGSEYYFTIAKTSVAASISATEVIVGNYVTIELEGVPGDIYFINAGKYLDVAPGQKGKFKPITDESSEDNKFTVTIESNGTVSLDLEAVKKGTANIKIRESDKQQSENGDLKKEIEVVVKDGVISAEASADSIYIGNKVTFTGVHDAGGDVFFWIKGTNLAITPLIVTDPAKGGKQASAEGKEWELEDVTLGNIWVDNKSVSLDAGTYTIYVGPYAEDENGVALKPTDDGYDEDYATVSLALKQPFITITKAPEVVVQGDDIEVIGTAEGKPEKVAYYVFGTNKFVYGTESVTNGKFTITIETSKKEDNKNYAATGQYFLVVQHPMYDKRFNIGAVNEETKGTLEYNLGDVVLNKNGDWNATTDENIALGTVLFNVKDRQTANAAQALCDALDSQDIDDMYVKASFIIAVPTSYIDPVPSQITKGQVLTISGTTTGHEGDIVLVELLSTAFAAVPKETVGSAAFTSLSTKIGEDGTWSVSFDTSNLNADDYTCSVAVADLGATTSKITIVEGTNPQPTQTTPVNPTAQPTAQPTATPATPGFGALAALAGLGAVAVLLLRRQ